MAAIPTEVISALLGAASGGGVTWLIHHQDVAQKRADKLRELLVLILELRQTGAGLDPRSPADVQMSGFLGQKREMYLSLARSLAAGSARSLKTVDYLLLGVECQMNSNWADAARFFEQGEKRSRGTDTLTQVFALRYRAEFFLASEPGHPARGNDFFRRAVVLTEDSDDPFWQFQTGYTYEQWARNPALQGTDLARENLEAAKRCYQAIAVEPMRQTTFRDFELRGGDRLT